MLEPVYSFWEPIYRGFIRKAALLVSFLQTNQLLSKTVAACFRHVFSYELTWTYSSVLAAPFFLPDPLKPPQTAAGSLI